MINKKRKFGIYKNNDRLHPKGDIWTLHRAYPTMEQALQALTDITRKPRRQRVDRYTILPVLDPHKRDILIKEDYIEKILKASR